jgi:hypothetical protein
MRDLQVGTVWVNDWVVMRDEFEEGGYKQSLRGRLRGLAALDDFSSTSISYSNPVSSQPESQPPRRHPHEAATKRSLRKRRRQWCARPSSGSRTGSPNLAYLHPSGLPSCHGRAGLAGSFDHVRLRL